MNLSILIFRASAGKPERLDLKIALKTQLNIYFTFYFKHIVCGRFVDILKALCCLLCVLEPFGHIELQSVNGKIKVVRDPNDLYFLFKGVEVTSHICPL